MGFCPLKVSAMAVARLFGPPGPLVHQIAARVILGLDGLLLTSNRARAQLGVRGTIRLARLASALYAHRMLGGEVS